MATCVELPLGPACVNLTGVRANDRNSAAMHLHDGPTPTDLTGLTLTAQARAVASDQGSPVLTADVTVVNAANGDIVVSWPGADVATLLANGAGPVLKSWKGVWDIQADNGVDDPQTLIEGKIAAV